MSKLNKLVTNYPVTLTPEEVENLSLTLSAVETAGGGTGDKTYHGDGAYIGVDNINNTIRLLDDAAAKLNRTIPSAVSDLSDSANYATVEDLSDYQLAGNYLSANALADLSGTWENVTAKLDKDEFADVSGTFLTAHQSLDDYATKANLESTSAEITAMIPTDLFTQASADTLYQPIGDYYSASNPSGFIDGLVVLDYGVSTWQDFLDAYRKNKVILCRVKSGNTGYRHGFVTWIDGTPENPTQVQFQYYRNINPHSANQQVDEIYIYTLLPDSTWSTNSRNTGAQIIAGAGLSSTFTARPCKLELSVTGDYATSSNLVADKQYTLTTTGWEEALKYDVTAAAGIEITTATDAGVKTFGISMTAEPVVTDTTLSGYNGIAAALDGNISGQWNVGLTQDMLDKIDAKLYSSAAEILYQAKGNYLSSNALDNLSGNWQDTFSAVSSNSAAWGSSTEYSAGPNITINDYVIGLSSDIKVNKLINGNECSAIGDYSHAEGEETNASGYCSHAEGSATSAIELYSHAEGCDTIAIERASHAEGNNTSASAGGSHTEGAATITTEQYAHAEGYGTSANGGASHTEGGFTYTYNSAPYAHAEGNYTSAMNFASHSEGKSTIAGGAYSHAEGSATSAVGFASHAEGLMTSAIGNYSHAEGKETSAVAAYSHAEGCQTKATVAHSTVVGEANAHANNALFIVGNGSPYIPAEEGDGIEEEGQEYSPSNAFVVFKNGGISAQGNISANGVELGSLNAGSGVEIVSNEINALLGTDLAFNATTSAIQINTNGSAWGTHAFVEGTNTSASGNGAHAEGADAGAFGQGAHAGGYGTHTTGVGNFIHGTFLNFASPDGTAVSNTPVFVGGTLNATTAQDYTDHGGYLQIMGNGTYRSQGQGDNSDAYILYRDGTVKAKDFVAGGDTLSANYPVPKSVPNTGDNTMVAQRMFVCTSDADIVAHAALSNGEGCIFFRVG